MITNEEISKRAREIWEREGRPEGRDKEHWLQAEAELQQSQPQENGAEYSTRDSSMMQTSSSMDNGKETGSRKRTARRAR
jgi:hypothetical protein